MMRRLSSKVHGVLDYTSVLFLAVSPNLFDMRLTVSVFTYSLALIHLLLTIFTDFEWGWIRVIPLRVHGKIELVVSLLLILVATWFRIAKDDVAFYFYSIFALVLFFVWLFSSYVISSVYEEKGVW